MKLPAAYRKRPVVVTAMRWTGDNTAEVITWANAVGDRSVRAEDADPPTLAIRTLEGVMRADLGDWIVCGVAHELYPVKPAIFEQTYQATT